jgi:hypothetical protein
MKFRLVERKRPQISVSAEGLVVVTANGSELVPWGFIERIAAFRWDIYLGVMVALAFEIEDGSTLRIRGSGSYRDLEEMMAERGVQVNHTTQPNFSIGRSNT